MFDSGRRWCILSYGCGCGVGVELGSSGSQSLSFGRLSLLQLLFAPSVSRSKRNLFALLSDDHS